MKLQSFHAIEEALKKPSPLMVLYIDAAAGSRVKAIADFARKQGVRLAVSNRTELQRMVPGLECRGIVLDTGANSQEQETIEDLAGRLEQEIAAGKKPLVLALDGITDPHNVGAMIRSADQFGITAVLVPERRSAQDGPVVHAASAGAVQWISLITVKNLVRSLIMLKEAGLWCIGADMNGEPAHVRDLAVPLLLVMGSEGNGLSRLVSETCDETVKVPTHGQVDSLNVSNAAAVLMYEIRRQQSFEW